MPTKARKARKRAGEKLIKEPKVGTPRNERFIPVYNRQGPFGFGAYPSARQKRKLAKQEMAAHPPEEQE